MRRCFLPILLPSSPVISLFRHFCPSWFTESSSYSSNFYSIVRQPQLEWQLARCQPSHHLQPQFYIIQSGLITARCNPWGLLSINLQWAWVKPKIPSKRRGCNLCSSLFLFLRTLLCLFLPCPHPIPYWVTNNWLRHLAVKLSGND